MSDTTFAAQAANPLLAPADLMPFDRIAAEHIGPAIDRLIADAEQALRQTTDNAFPATWVGVSKVLDVATERLSRTWSAVSHLHSVADQPPLRAAYNQVLPKVSAFWTQLGADERLYAKYKAIDASTLNAEQSKARSNALRNFVLSGAELQGDAKQRFAQIQARLAELGQKFSENLLDATDGFAYYATADEVGGLPADLLQSCQQAAQADKQQGYKLTLKLPCYLPVMQFAHSSALRERMYQAYCTRASDMAADKQHDNSAIITELLALRAEEAQLLGFANFAELSLATKMAHSPQQVTDFLSDLARRARPFAEKDLADLRAFSGQQQPKAWDIPYLSERLKEERYAYSEQEVKAYFPAPKVLQGLFKIVETLFEVDIRRDSAPVWHPSVEFYRIERRNDQGALQLVGQFYLDPSARSGKRGGAWMDEVRARWLRPDNGQLQTPIAHLVCNFAEGVGGKPPLLTHDDVITLFHEFGHGLHHMLTQVNERDVSGINGVEWDAVELPSQFMENFCWEWDVVKHMTAHVDTGAQLPRDLFDKMLAAKNFQSGLQTLRQIEFALFDMRLHMQNPAPADCLPLLNQVRSEVAVLQPPAYNRMPHSFSHIFAGGYAAGYYSYKWAELLSADAYAALEENADTVPSRNISMGRKYRQNILEVGGSRTAMESFVAFRGREPQIDALLQHQGMA